MVSCMKKDIYYTIGQNIKQRRKAKGYTQSQLADELFLSLSFIAKLESITKQTISVDTLEKFAKALDCKITDFFQEVK